MVDVPTQICISSALQAKISEQKVCSSFSYFSAPSYQHDNSVHNGKGIVLIE